VLVVGGIKLLKTRKAQLASVPTAEILPVVVDTVTLEKQQVTLTLPAMGLVASDLSTTLSTKVSGRITHVYKQEGDAIQKGDKLASIDASDLAAKKEGLHLNVEGVGFQIAGIRENIRALNTSLAAARETHARTLELLAVKGASEEQSRQEEAGIAAINAKISEARNSISTLNKSRATLEQNIKEIDSLLVYTVITAPIDGTLSKRLVMAGDMAMPGKTLFKIAARTGRYVNLSLPDAIHPTEIIFKGKKLPLTAKNEAGTAGLAQYIAPLPDDDGLVEGQYINLRVVVYENNDVLVPVDGLLSVGERAFVFTYGQSKAIKTTVDIVARGQEGVVVRPDLSGKTILLAKPDILLRAASGVPVLATEKIGLKLEDTNNG
jgi:multidrug efflux pump subunit AcrA (membrane-fusion protein)